jgi:hypothetical protein
MPQPDRAPAVGRLRVADSVDQVCFNPALRVDSGSLNIGAAPQTSHIAQIEKSCELASPPDIAHDN